MWAPVAVVGVGCTNLESCWSPRDLVKSCVNLGRTPGFESQLSLWLALQPWPSHFTSLEPGFFFSPKTGIMLSSPPILQSSWDNQMHLYIQNPFVSYKCLCNSGEGGIMLSFDVTGELKIISLGFRDLFVNNNGELWSRPSGVKQKTWQGGSFAAI